MSVQIKEMKSLYDTKIDPTSEMRPEIRIQFNFYCSQLQRDIIL